MKNHIVNLEQEYGCTIGVELQNFTTGEFFFSYQAEHVLSSASSIKLFFAGACLEAVRKKNLSLESLLPVQEAHLVRGASILGDLHVPELDMHTLLYLLLAHSDTSGQNVLEQVVSSDEVNTYIQDLGCTRTRFVSKHLSSETTFSQTTPRDAVTFMCKLWNKELLTEELCALLLTFLSQSRHTHFGLRYLPTALTMKNPPITERYSKAGKVARAINDTLVLKTAKGVLGVGVFVDNFIATKDFNSVDNEGILLVSKLTQYLFNEWYKTNIESENSS